MNENSLNPTMQYSLNVDREDENGIPAREITLTKGRREVLASILLPNIVSHGKTIKKGRGQSSRGGVLGFDFATGKVSPIETTIARSLNGFFYNHCSKILGRSIPNHSMDYKNQDFKAYHEKNGIALP